MNQQISERNESEWPYLSRSLHNDKLSGYHNEFIHESPILMMMQMVALCDRIQRQSLPFAVRTIDRDPLREASPSLHTRKNPFLHLIIVTVFSHTVGLSVGPCEYFVDYHQAPL